MECIGIGRFTKDPVLKPLEEKGTCVCEFSLAVEEYRKVQDGNNRKMVHYFDYVIWDKAAEVIAEYCKKGDLIFIRGTLRNDKWTNKDGEPRSKTIIRVDHFKLLGRLSRSADETE